MLSADPGPPAPPASPPSLTSLLAMTENPDGSGVEYVIGGQQLARAERGMAAQLLADDAMRIRCGRSPVLARWRARRDGGPPETGAPAAAVEVYAAEFEVDLLRLRSCEGMAVGRAKGKLRGKQPKLTIRQQAELARMHATGEYTIAELMEVFCVGRASR